GHHIIPIISYSKYPVNLLSRASKQEKRMPGFEIGAVLAAPVGNRVLPSFTPLPFSVPAHARQPRRGDIQPGYGLQTSPGSGPIMSVSRPAPKRRATH